MEDTNKDALEVSEVIPTILSFFGSLLSRSRLADTGYGGGGQHYSGGGQSGGGGQSYGGGGYDSNQGGGRY